MKPLINELKELQDRLAQIIKDNSVPDLFERIVAVSKEIPNPNKPDFNIRAAPRAGIGHFTYYETLQTFAVDEYSNIIIPEGTQFSINGFVLQIIENKVLATLEPRINFGVSEPFCLPELLDIKPNTRFTINNALILYTNQISTLDSLTLLKSTDSCYVIETPLHDLTAIFKYDHVQLQFAGEQLTQLPEDLELIVHTLELVEKVKLSRRREKFPNYYKLVDLHYAYIPEEKVEEHSAVTEPHSIDKPLMKWLKQFFKTRT